jgi:hypothetical protein
LVPLLPQGVVAVVVALPHQVVAPLQPPLVSESLPYQVVVALQHPVAVPPRLLLQAAVVPQARQPHRHRRRRPR